MHDQQRHWRYRYAGLAILSELELPEWAPFACPGPATPPDVTIRLTPEAAGAPAITADEYRFEIAQVGAYTVRAGREIAITTAPGAAEREVRLFLLGSAWGALCYQRGLLVLHTSVVGGAGGAVAFCGASGAGKSSLAALLASYGHPLIGDDLCHVEACGGGRRVYPAAPRLKLWQSALDQLGWSAAGLERDHMRMEKFHLVLTASGGPFRPLAGHEPVPLRAIYLLTWGDLGIERLRGVAALTQLVEAATYRGDLLEPMGQVAAHWRRCAAFADGLPIFRLSRPNDWAAMPEVVPLLRDQWLAL